MRARDDGRLPPWTAPAAGGLATIAGLIMAGLLIAPPLLDNWYALRPSVRGGAVALGLFLACGEALSWAVVPRAWGVAGRLMAVPLGAAVSGLVLTALGLAHLPLRISEWVLISGGLGASLLVRRRRGRVAGGEPAAAAAGPGWQCLCWLAALAVVGVVALAPAARTGLTTIYGQNPDAHQVVGIATLFQHVSPTGTDTSLPIDTVPPNWRFRYPIFYGLAAVSSLGHLDPIRAFPLMAALLLACLALGFGAFAVLCLGAPAWSAPVIGAAVALAANTLHLVWHPYWNQLWGLAIFPWALVTGWRAVVDTSRAAAALFALMLLTLALAYPLALPYPVLIIGSLALAYRRHRLVPRLWGRSGVAGVLTILILAPAIAGAALKLGQGVVQLFSGNSALWGGDVTRDLPFGRFVGVGGGAIPALLVLLVALPTLALLPRREARALGVSLGLLILLDVRFRLAPRGAYIDFKHLSFVGALVLALAATGVARLAGTGAARLTCKGLNRPGAWRSWVALAGSVAVALAWTAVAVRQSHAELQATNPQVDLAMLEIRSWAHELPRGASVRVDIPPSGLQLWAVYMLGDHPVDTPTQILGTTYAIAPYGTRASYSLSLRYVPGTVRPTPRPVFAADPPVASNAEYVLRKIDWPARLGNVPDTASTTLIEP